MSTGGSPEAWEPWGGGALGPAALVGAPGLRIPSVLASPSPLCSKLHAGVFLLWTSYDVSSPAFPKLPWAMALVTFPQSPRTQAELRGLPRGPLGH